MGKAKQTVQAAIERRDRDAEEAGADDDAQSIQHWVSQPLYEKAVREGRDPGEAVGTA